MYVKKYKYYYLRRDVNVERDGDRDFYIKYIDI